MAGLCSRDGLPRDLVFKPVESDTNSGLSVSELKQSIEVGVEKEQYYFYLKFSLNLRQ